MQLNEMKCPECGAAPEIRIRHRASSLGSAEIRCPYNHFQYGTAFHEGSEKWVRETLIENWKEIISKNKGG